MGVLKMSLKNKHSIQSNLPQSPTPHGPADTALALFMVQYETAFSILIKHHASLNLSDHRDSQPHIGVAYSGGADSTALLLAANRLWPRRVMALHVHHGLQQAGDIFLQHSKQQCQTWQIPFEARHVDARNVPGESPENAARTHRYKALAEMAQRQQLSCVLLAQHADDQVETLLLALSRGAGLPGLASMPAIFERHGTYFARPLLSAGAKELRQWLAEQHIAWVEDPTNQDRCYTRNRIRLDVLPSIEAAFPAYRKTFARSIEHTAQAQELLTEVAQQDLQHIGIPPVIKSLQTLSPARQTNALRHWLKEVHNTAPSSRQLLELLRLIAACQTRGHKIDIKVGHGKIVRAKDVLQYRALPNTPG